MNRRFAFLFIISLLTTLSACTSLQRKMDPEKEYSTDSGFRFRFPMAGEWFPGPEQKGTFTLAKKPAVDGRTTLVVVSHGPILTPGGVSMTNQQLLDGFKKQVEAEAQNGRVTKVKSSFVTAKRGGADCMLFEQTGQDNPATGAMSMNKDGMVCLHPRKPYSFIWMGMSERWPLGQARSESFAGDKKKFFDSLQFID